MLFNVPGVISPEQAAEIRQKLEKAEWVDGRLSAGQQAAKVKSNRELKKGQPAELEAGAMIRSALEQNKVFNMVSLSFKVSPPLFNRYEGDRPTGPISTTPSVRPRTSREGSFGCAATFRPPFS